MNRECGCQHNARNIKVNPISGIDIGDRDSNVQNYLEILAGQDLQIIIEKVNNLNQELRNLKEEISNIKNGL